MPNGNRKAKIFISCGQTVGSGEVEIAHRIAERLIQIGFEVYVAIEEQSLLGIRENIFTQLQTSEYFLFIDFKREQIANGDGLHRGSLFCHQELALASFLEMPLIALQENGVKREDGLMRYLQANSTPFTDRHLLPNVVSDLVQSNRWDSNWKNEIILENETNLYADAFHLQHKRNGRFFHIRAKNLHPHKPATNCYAYLEQVIEISSGMVIPTETVELKWAGYVFPNAVISPQSYRLFDAFWVFLDDPSIPQFNLFSDSSRYIPQIRGPGEFKLTYSLISENFRFARASFLLNLSNNLNEVRLQKI